MPSKAKHARLPGLRSFVVVLALAGTNLAPLPAAGQSADAEARLKKIEAEVRALQRKVFPGGDSRLFQPEIVPPDADGASVAPATSTSALTDMLGRLDSIERQLSRLTAQTEENTNALSQISIRLEALEAAEAARIEATEAAVAAAATAAEPQVAPDAQGTLGAVQADPAKPEPALPSPERVEAVKAIVKPQTADPGDDEYIYGFRLWSAGFYPEARQQLQLSAENHADHWRASYSRNLLGRAFMDDGKLEEAVPVFINNYEADKNGARAPDSLLFLAETLIKLNDKRACIALNWFSDGYPALRAGRLQDQYNALVRQVKCD